MQRLGVSGAVRPIYGSLGVKRLIAGPFKSFTTQTVTRDAGNNSSLSKLSQPVLMDNNF